MASNVPPVPPRVTPNEDILRRQEQREQEFLDAEAKARSLQNREFDQRFWLRWLAVVLGIIVIVFMSIALLHMAHSALSPNIQYLSPAFAVAMIVAPVLSITAITVTILIGAFRRFGDSDLDGSSGAVAGAISALNTQ